MDKENNTKSDAALIGPSDPAPFELLNPSSEKPMLLVCDHASKAVPSGMNNLGLEEATMNLHVGWDIGAAEVARRLAKDLNCMAVLAGYSRLVIDNNRQPGDPTGIPAASDDIIIPGNQDLSEAEQIARTDQFFWPYHHAITEAIAHLWRNGLPPAVFSVHTFTPSMNGEDRLWHIGVLWNRDPRMAEPLIQKLRDHGEGFHVGDNQPYSGKDIAFSLDMHAGGAGLPHCAVEIRQDLVTSPSGAEFWAEVLSEVLRDILSIDDLHQVEHF
ncbi:MAG: N-formylglutamate amidohydrolase [Rhodospirillaceae bacterium]|nr:N-formylglutamate amidohydrolase [Rhodospirillaceae bacterium]